MSARALAIAGLVVLVLAALFLLPLQEVLRAALEWTAENRRIAWAAFIGLYVVACVAMLPGLVLTIAAGAIFGLVAGVALVSVGSVLGATAAFLVGRTLARGWIARRIEGWPRFRALDRALGRRGFWIVLLTRLSPAFPFNLLNYAYGLTSVRLREYVLGSWIGMFPATVAYVYAGSAAATLAQVLAGEVTLGTEGRVLLGAGLLATVLVVVLVTRLARRELDRELEAA
jgi:uncharacterized membrane protein YdjX (TVP38/TMEM64 family)